MTSDGGVNRDVAAVQPRSTAVTRLGSADSNRAALSHAYLGRAFFSHCAHSRTASSRIADRPVTTRHVSPQSHVDGKSPRSALQGAVTRCLVGGHVRWPPFFSARSDAGLFAQGRDELVLVASSRAVGSPRYCSPTSAFPSPPFSSAVSPSPTMASLPSAASICSSAPISALPAHCCSPRPPVSSSTSMPLVLSHHHLCRRWRWWSAAGRSWCFCCPVMSCCTTRFFFRVKCRQPSPNTEFVGKLKLTLHDRR